MVIGIITLALSRQILEKFKGDFLSQRWGAWGNGTILTIKCPFIHFLFSSYGDESQAGERTVKMLAILEFVPYIYIKVLKKTLCYYDSNLSYNYFSHNFFFFKGNLGKIITFHFRAHDYVGRGGSQMFNHQPGMGTEGPNRHQSLHLGQMRAR